MPYSQAERPLSQRKVGNPLGQKNQFGPKKFRRIWMLIVMTLPVLAIFELKFLNWLGLMNSGPLSGNIAPSIIGTGVRVHHGD